MISDTTEQHSLTPKEHWELHQGMWKSIGCDMVLDSNFLENQYSYIDRKNNYRYTYFSKDKRIKVARIKNEFKSLG
jgi:hypothetical protein